MKNYPFVDSFSFKLPFRQGPAMFRKYLVQLARKFYELERRFVKGAPIVQNLCDCVDDKNISLIKRISESSSPVLHPIPKTIDGGTDTFFVERHNIPVYPTYLLLIKNARITSGSGLLFLSNGNVSLEHTHYYSFYIHESPDYFHLFNRKAKRVKGSYYSLIGYCPGEHYHMMIDFTQRLYHIIEELPSHVNYLMPAKVGEAVIQALVYLGIPKERMVFIDQSENIIVDELYWSPPAHESGFANREVLRAVSSSILKSSNLPTTDRSGLVYISRVGKRRVVNEKKLIDQLSILGFKVYELSRLSLEEQIRIFSDARMVIAPHGAGLVNLMFCAPGTEVLELLPDPILWGGTCYWSIATAMNLNYTYQKCRPISADVNTSDITVDVEKVFAWARARLEPHLK